MDAHRIDILDRTDDDGIVRLVADDLHFILFPTEHRFFDQHFGGRRGIKAAGDDLEEFFLVIRNAAAGAAHGEAGADDGRQANEIKRNHRFVNIMCDLRAWAFKTDLRHGVAEFQPVLGLVDGFGIGADQLDIICRQRAVTVQRQRGVERRLATHCRQHRIGAFLGDDLGDDFGGDRLDISGIGQIGIGHDRRRVRIDEDDAIAFRLQRLDGLRARIIELAGLADDDRACADDQDGFYVSAFGHLRPLGAARRI